MKQNTNGAEKFAKDLLKDYVNHRCDMHDVVKHLYKNYNIYPLIGNYNKQVLKENHDRVYAILKTTFDVFSNYDTYFADTIIDRFLRHYSRNSWSSENWSFRKMVDLPDYESKLHYVANMVLTNSDNFNNIFEARYETVPDSYYVINGNRVGSHLNRFTKSIGKVRKLLMKQGTDLSNVYVENKQVKQALYNFLDKGSKVVDKSKVTSKFKQITYKGFVEDYFKEYGFKFNDSANAPALSKQLTKQKVPYDNKELIAISEFKGWYMLSLIENGMKPIFYDTTDLRIPYNVDPWAFAGSCNISTSEAGSHTHLFLDAHGWEYLKIYSLETSKKLVPHARAYFYRDDKDIAHAGMYTSYNLSTDFSNDKLHTTGYQALTFILCVIFGKKVTDFDLINGMDWDNEYERVCDGYGDEEYCYIWFNSAQSTRYNKYGTNENILEDIIVDGGKIILDIREFEDNKEYRSFNEYTAIIKLY